jgi:hypothetical protein
MISSSGLGSARRAEDGATGDRPTDESLNEFLAKERDARLGV